MTDVVAISPDGELSSSPPRYTMQISRLTIDKLGIKLYDRVSAVLAELIANSYDADATKVDISLPWSVFLSDVDDSSPGMAITVSDNGHGMTAKEVNDYYLLVGGDRRTRPTAGSESREKSRPVMGRKGIGKLAPFGICKRIELVTAGGEKDPIKGWQVSHLILDLDAMLQDSQDQYNPEPGHLDGTYKSERGTTITLTKFMRKRVASGDELNRQLAARFGLQRSDWVVSVKNSIADDADGSELTEFVLGDLKIDKMDQTEIDVSSRPVEFDGQFLPVSGWIAYSKSPYKDQAMAGVRIFARGKLVAQTRDFGISAGFTGEFKLRSYLVGAIHAEWLDDGEDLVRSDRQDIIWNSDLGEALSVWGIALIKELARMGEDSVKKRVWDEFVEKSDIDAQLMAMAPGDPFFRDSVKQAAKLLVSNKDRAALDDERHVKNVVQLAMSLGPQRTLLSALHEIADGAADTLDVVVGLFEKASLAEVYSLGQVASDRIQIVDRLEALIEDGKSREQPFQELIERAPWILAPEWTPLGMNESLKRVRASFEGWFLGAYGEEISTSAIQNNRREPDFVLLNDSGVLWIVEIKRMNHHLTNDEYDRGMLYLEALDRFLEENSRIGEKFPKRRLTFIVDHVDKLSPVYRSSLKSDDRIDQYSWRSLLDATQRAHRDFLARVTELRQTPVSDDSDPDATVDESDLSVPVVSD